MTNYDPRRPNRLGWGGGRGGWGWGGGWGAGWIIAVIIILIIIGFGWGGWYGGYYHGYGNGRVATEPLNTAAPANTLTNRPGTATTNANGAHDAIPNNTNKP